MKISVSSYSFSQLRLNDYNAIALASLMGFEGIEFAEIHPEEGADKLAYAQSLKEYADSLGVEITNYVIGADFINRELESEIERLRGEVDVAEKLGVRVMRHDASGGPEGERYSLTGFENYVDILADGCRAVTQYAASRGIRTCVENHGYYCQQSDRVRLLMEKVDNPNFGWLVDIGNFMCADEASLDAVKNTKGFITYAHVKDFYYKDKSEACPDGWFDTRGGNHLCGSIPGNGVVPVKECIDIIKSYGYDGWVTLEYEGLETPLTAVPKGYEFLKKTV